MDKPNLSEILQKFSQECDLDGFLGRLVDPFSRTQLDRLGRIFTANHSSNINIEKRETIPKVIHQIWIGPKPLPSQYKTFMAGWRRHYPDWEHRLWTDAEVNQLDYASRDIVETSTCFGQKSDLLRAEILYKQGGLYIDTDYESIKPLGDIHDHYDFYGTLRAIPLLYLASPTIYPSPLLACNSMIGSRPGHPIIGAYLDKVRDINRHPSYFQLSWPERLTLARVKFSQAQVQRIKETTIKTYIPYHFAVLDQIQSGTDRNIMFPPTFFNPIDTWHSYRFIFWRYWAKRAEYWAKHSKGPIRSYQQPLPHTYAIHHSKASWAGL